MRNFLPQYVAHGLTGIRDMGGRLDVLSDYRTTMQQGGVAWPRVIAAGQVLDGLDPVQPEVSIAVTDTGSAVADVDSLKLAVPISSRCTPYLPAALRTEWSAKRQGKLGRGSDCLARKRAWHTDETWVARAFVRERVPLLAGSDAGVAFSYPGSSLHDELALLVEMGMTPRRALRAATLSPADFLGERHSMGAIEAGQVADMALLRANPLADIAATRTIEAVILRDRRPGSTRSRHAARFRRRRCAIAPTAAGEVLRVHSALRFRFTNQANKPCAIPVKLRP